LGGLDPCPRSSDPRVGHTHLRYVEPVKASLDEVYAEALAYAGPKPRWLERVAETRSALARFFGVDGSEIAFTKNTSEGLNICANGLSWEPGDNVLVLEAEHPNNVYAWLAKQALGLEVRFVHNERKWADSSTFGAYLDGRTRAIAVSHIMFHDGARNDIEGIAELGRSCGVEVVVDAMQSVGVLPLDFGALGAAAVASGTHKGLSDPIRGSWGDGAAPAEGGSVAAEGEHRQGDQRFG
jgi:cysteine desulfurase/selenocysteine lyase